MTPEERRRRIRQRELRRQAALRQMSKGNAARRAALDELLAEVEETVKDPEAGMDYKDAAEAAGLTRQRLWQLQQRSRGEPAAEAG